jgi:hypothetical protein
MQNIAPNIAPGLQEETVEFLSHGETVRGILTTPQGLKPSRLLICSHGWSGTRSGPTGILTFLARHISRDCKLAVLRFDYRGRGNSDGDGLAVTLETMADDLVAATEFGRRYTGCQHPAYLGLCSGGNVVVGSLGRLPRPSALLLLSVYPFSDGDNFGRDLGRLRHLLGAYWRKLCSLENWRRLLRGEASLGRVASVLRSALFRGARNRRKETADALEAAPSAPTSGNIPGCAVKAAAKEGRKDAEHAPRQYLRHLTREISALFLYGSQDPDAASAKKYYGQYAEERRLPVIFQTIDGANHNFSALGLRQQVADACAEFLRHRQDKNSGQ